MYLVWLDYWKNSLKVRFFVFNRVLPQSYYGFCTLERSRMLRFKIFKMPKSTFNNLTVQRHHFRELTDGLIQLFLLEELTNQDRTSNGVPFPSFYFLAVISGQFFVQKCQIHSKTSSFFEKYEIAMKKSPSSESSNLS